MTTKKQSKGKDHKKKTRNQQKYTITIIKERCKGCKLCIEYCPSEILEISNEMNYNGYFVPNVKDPKKCIGCNLCSKYCPDFAIFCTKK